MIYMPVNGLSLSSSNRLILIALSLNSKRKTKNAKSETYFPRKLISNKVMLIVAVKVEIINEIVGRFMLKIFWLRGCTITTSFGRRK